ncbi:MAG: hypothetical protein ACFFEY_14445 [Candidatus Thorarchaeota archaeon]
MSFILFSLFELLIFIFSLVLGAYIFRIIAREYELDPSFKTAFTLNFVIQLITILVFIIPVLTIVALQVLGITLYSSFFYVLVPIYIGIFGLTLYIDILCIQKFYEIDFKESFSMLRLSFVYNILIMVPLTPFVLSILNL